MYKYAHLVYIKLYTMKKILSAIAITVAIASCSLFSPYGKAVKINDSLEVYIKGDNATEADAKKLGTYLADLWKENTNHKSIQLLKENNIYIVKMVADEKVLKEDPSLITAFAVVRSLIEENVFKGSKVKLVLTDDKFKDIKTYDGSNDVPATTTDSTNNK